jgi:Tol biopolymer transport system component
MACTPGSQLGHYQIVSALGKGGMGEVWRARDTTLGREVAIKTLPDEFAQDVDRLVRFEREARLLASLNHPNIAGIHGLEEHGGTRFLVLELVEGDTLADRIQQGPIPVEEALKLALQIAEALEAAHERGVIHRDLKPGNIKVTDEGQVKVLDFGLAKAFAGETGDVGVSNSPTLSMAATQAGVILGTAAYMSPEQAKGRPTDTRADVWAFGCVMFEMLTGRQVFAAEDVSTILARVLDRDPDFTALPKDLHPRLRDVLRRCLQKNAKQRYHAIADVRFDIESVLADPSGVLVHSEAAAARGVPQSKLPWIAAVVTGAVVAGAIVLDVRPAPVNLPETRLDIATPATDEPTSLAVSPDGRYVAYRAAAGGTHQLWLRSLDSDVAYPLPGTADGFLPFWSPDSRSIGFVSNQQLRRIDIDGGASRLLRSAARFGAAFGPDSSLLFTVTNTAPIYRIPLELGTPVAVTSLESSQAGHRLPRFLPDGRHFLFYATGTPDARGVYIGSLDSMETRRLVAADSIAVFAPPEHVLYALGETLYAQRLDLETLQLSGTPFVVANNVALNSSIFGSVAASVSSTGIVAYRRAMTETRQFSWVDRSGRQLEVVGQVETALSTQTTRIVEISPDAETVALVRSVEGNLDVWLIDTARGVPRPFTTDRAFDLGAVWSPDGARLVFASSRHSGQYDIFEQSARSGDAARLILQTAENKNVSDWSSDGRFVLYTSQTSETGARDIWALPMDGGEPFVVLQTDFEEHLPRFSPDVDWIVYESNQSGRVEVYAQAFPGPGVAWPISTGGGELPAWSADGRAIFYLDPDNRLMRVAVSFGPDGTLDAGVPVALFDVPARSGYAVARDGERFLINAPVGAEVTSPITVILNWNPENAQ